MTALIPSLRRHGWLRSSERDMFDRFFEDFGLPRLFGDETTFTPAFDVSENDNALVVKAEVPGMDQKDIEISISNGLLTIQGEKKRESREENEHYHRVERSYGSFCRTLHIPTEVDSEKVDATYQNGVLTVTLPKLETAKPKKIEVKS